MYVMSIALFNSQRNFEFTLPQSFSFFFFIEKTFKNGKYTVKMLKYLQSLNSPPPVHTHMLTCIRTLWMVP